MGSTRVRFTRSTSVLGDIAKRDGGKIMGEVHVTDGFTDVKKGYVKELNKQG